MWPAFLAWLRDNQIGDLTGLAGLALSLVGFAATLFNVYKSRAAAERAEAAAWAARDNIRLFETVVDFSTAITMLEDIKRGHRQGHWLILLERYAAVRKVLVMLHASNPDLDAEHKRAIQATIATVSAIEQTVEAGLTRPENLKAERFNRGVSRGIDRLIAVLVEIKTTRAGDGL